MLSLLLYLTLGSLSYSVDVSDAKMLDFKEDFLKAPVVIRVGGVTEEAAELFSKNIQEAVDSGEPIIPVLIDSYGGSIYGLLRMIDTMQATKVPIATICLGKCMSAGAMLLAMGTEGLRFAAPNSTILLHDASSSFDGKLPDIKNEARELDRLNRLIFSLIAKNIGKPEDYFTDILDKKGHIDWFLNPEEAKKHNIVNQIKLPRIKIKVKTTMILE